MVLYSLYLINYDRSIYMYLYKVLFVFVFVRIYTAMYSNEIEYDDASSDVYGQG